MAPPRFIPFPLAFPFHRDLSRHPGARRKRGHVTCDERRGQRRDRRVGRRLAAAWRAARRRNAAAAGLRRQPRSSEDELQAKLGPKAARYPNGHVLGAGRPQSPRSPLARSRSVTSTDLLYSPVASSIYRLPVQCATFIPLGERCSNCRLTDSTARPCGG